MSIGSLIRDLRLTRGWSQQRLAELLAQAASRADGGPGTDQVKRWERGRVIPGPMWLPHLAVVLDVPLPTLEAEASLSRVDRREFLTLTALTATHGRAASDMLTSVAGGDDGPLTTAQTTHATDLVIASLADRASLRHLRRWATDGGTPVLRVNAAGILAKAGDRQTAQDVVKVLAHDLDVRILYSTAVVARTCALDWDVAQRLAVDPLAEPRRAAYLGRRLIAEIGNHRDVGARWCAAAMLRDLSPLLGR